jgi:3-hydroxyacyl-[acyl-carrier-protein] dehydratase
MRAVTMGYEEIKRHIPHRRPFLLLDEILELSEGRIVALKRFSGNERFFQGHFPGEPSVPQVYFLEAAAQAAGVHAAVRFGLEGARIVVSGIHNATFAPVPVRPGDSVRIEVELLRFGGRIARVRAKVSVESDRIMEADITAVVT